MIKVQLPGKLMLLGEHAVVYGYSCISSAVNSYMTVSMELSKEKDDQIDLKNHMDTRFIDSALKILRGSYEIAPLYISTHSDISGKGLGSSAATVVGTVLGALSLSQIVLSQKEIFDLCHSAILDIQPIASGFDVATQLMGGTISFNGKNKTSESVSKEKLPMFAVYTGNKGDTVSYIEKVKRFYRENPAEVTVCFEEIADLVTKSKEYLLKKDYLNLGKAMTLNHSLLKTLDVTTPELDRLVDAALSSGAWGAKVSGAGGGDCLIVLCDHKKEKEIKNTLRKLAGQALEFSIGDAAGATIIEYESNC